MFAEVPVWIQDVGELALAATAVIGLITIGARSRPGKWIVRKVREDVAESRKGEIRDLLDEQMPIHLAPVLEQLPNYVRPILDQLLPNGGASFRDEVRGHMSVTSAQLSALDGRVRKIEEDMVTPDDLPQAGTG